MHPPVSPEQKEGMRELRDLQPPTFPRIAKIAGVHVTTVREIASRENWPKLHVPKGTVMQVARLKDLEADGSGAREGGGPGGDERSGGRRAARRHRRACHRRDARDPDRGAPHRTHRQGARRRVVVDDPRRRATPKNFSPNRAKNKKREAMTNSPISSLASTSASSNWLETTQNGWSRSALTAQAG